MTRQIEGYNIRVKEGLMTSYQPLKAELRHMYSGMSETKSHMLSQLKGNRFYIRFNRPKKYNAFSLDMFFTYLDLILYANQNPDIKYIILSGNGGNYSSGNDLMNFTDPNIIGKGTLEAMATVSAEMVSDSNIAIINSKKPIFAITEGKVIGFAFTQLALFDRVFAVSNSEFNVPLVQLAQGPEMGSSYTFPKIFGKQVGQDLIVSGKKVDSAFLEKYGMASSHKSRAQAEEALNKHLQSLDNLDWTSYVKCRQLFREIDRQQLLKANKRQVANLIERWVNPQLPNLIVEYMARMKSKSKL